MYDVVKTYVTEKIGDLTGLEVMATCPRSSQSKIRKRNTGNGVSCTLQGGERDSGRIGQSVYLT